MRTPDPDIIEIKLFYIRRNKNRNEVHYSVKVSAASCKPVGVEPVFAYWINYEHSPADIESIGPFEALAYGIKSQTIVGKVLEIQLRALPQRKIRIEFSHNGACLVLPKTFIEGSDAVLKEISVFATEGLLGPSVKYIDITGERDGVVVTERVLKN